jgi:hypothetical protein
MVFPLTSHRREVHKVTAPSSRAPGAARLGARSAPARALNADIAGVDRARRANVQSVTQHSTESHVGTGFRQMNFADQVAAGVVATDTIFLRIGPTHAAPDVTFDIALDAVGQSGCKAFCKDLPIGHLAGGNIDVE